MKHVTVRFAWHDNKWNGAVCRDPKGNFYCRDNYSLISPRIQKRIRLDTEDSFKERPISETVLSKHYVPPCYWTINALGENDCQIEDPHPFQDIQRHKEKFSTQVPPLKNTLRHHSVFTWCFKLGFAEEGDQTYVPTPELKRRVDIYTGELEKGKSIAFFYSNFSNPLTGDDYRYALLGAGLVDDVKKPVEYTIPEPLLEEMRRPKSMQNFPTMAWQFQINLEPDSAFVMPYHDYLKWKDEEQGSGTNERWKKVEEIAIPVEEGNIIPHFKYVSMQVNHDKAIYLLYLFKRSLRKMKEHGEIVPFSEIEKLDEKVDKLLKVAWKNRGQYPGFVNVIQTYLKSVVRPENLGEVASSVRNYIVHEAGSIDEFFKAQKKFSTTGPAISKALHEIERNKDTIAFLSSFDFSVNQFTNIREIINKEGFRTVKNNPYLILEKYHYDGEDSWNIDQSDYGINLYQIDTALIPDLDFAEWQTSYSPDSPERIRAVISKILYDAARQGSSCLSREEIVEAIKSYPLFYITENLEIDIDRLIEYEKQPLFKQKFVIQDESFRGGPVLYQLKQLKDVEQFLEQFLKRMIAKRQEPDTNDDDYVEQTANGEKQRLGNKLILAERKRLYRNALGSGLFLLSGKAGSGKTSAIVNLIQKFRRDGDTPIFVFTPTGKANIVIRDRLRSVGLQNDSYIKVSTIHRFLYSAIFDAIRSYQAKNQYRSYGQYGSYRTSPQVSQQAYRMVDLVSKILSGKLEVMDEFMETSKNFRFTPKIVIIDEASMIDEVLLAALFAMLNPDTLKHMILVGDEKQLPPIGAGRPFVDTIFYLKREGNDGNYIRLESNLRFDQTARIGYLAELFGGDKVPFPTEMADALSQGDNSLEVSFFSSYDEMKALVKRTLKSVGNVKDGFITNMFGDVFEDSKKPVLDKIQVITPRRVGSFGAMSINTNIVKEGIADFSPRTKLICEENKYVWIKKDGKFKRVLALANGSVGYIMSDGTVSFDDLEDFESEYGRNYEIEKIKKEVSDDSIKIERDINFGYAITVHKAQGSDYEHVILVIPEMSPFIMRELLYTAFTRTKTKLHLMVHSSLKDELPLILVKAYENSSVEQRKTLLFGHKSSPYRPYVLTLKNGTAIEVRTKIEQMIARSLDSLGLEFEYEPQDFLQEYRVLPDFKFYVDGRAYYLEHLGNMAHRGYRNRWMQKMEIYQNIGIADELITTTESDEASDTERNIFQIVSDVKSKSLKVTAAGYSKHHYVI